MKQDKWTRDGVIEITVKRNGIIISKDVVKNLIMDIVLDEMSGQLVGEPSDLEIKYCALGTGNTAPTGSDTLLDTEIYRGYRTDLFEFNAEVVSEFIFLTGEGTGAIKEIGIFGGASATSSVDSGRLLARFLYDRVKTANDEWIVRRMDILRRG